jgi:hypothetical protein
MTLSSSSQDPHDVSLILQAQDVTVGVDLSDRVSMIARKQIAMVDEIEAVEEGERENAIERALDFTTAAIEWALRCQKQEIWCQELDESFEEWQIYETELLQELENITQFTAVVPGAVGGA